MLKVAQTKLSIVFWVLTALDIGCITVGLQWPHWLLKALLVPALLLLARTAEGHPGKFIFFSGLACSWLGDILLLCEARDPLFFILGLASFFLTHILYIVFFLGKRAGGRSLLIRQPFWLVLIPTYGIALVYLLYPKLGDLRVPVIAYAVVISSMLLCSMHVFAKVSRRSGFFYSLGALAFVFSDSLLAVNKFYQPFAYAGVCIMFTYCLAQFLIVKGFLEEQCK